MLCGAGGSGKSTFINTICQQQVISFSELNKNIPRPENSHLDPGIQLNHLTVGMFYYYFSIIIIIFILTLY